MPVDHSLTYRTISFRNIPHRYRFNLLLSLLTKTAKKTTPYADFGCSNGYLTNAVVGHLNIDDATGFDHERENLAIAKEKYLHINFEYADLNNPLKTGQRYALITCLETIEHVGSMDVALKNLLDALSEGGTLVISVPIEIGYVGIVKFLLKRIVYRYSVDELDNKDYSDLRYLRDLLMGRDISKYRPPASGYGTHFGFDYRRVGHYLRKYSADFSAYTKLTTKIFIVKK